MKKIITTLLWIGITLFYFIFSTLVNAEEQNRMKFLLGIKLEKNYKVDSSFVSWVTEMKDKNKKLLKDKFKGYRKDSKTQIGWKEWNIWEVFTGKNGKSLRKALKKRLHVDDPIKKVLGLENIIAKVRKIEKQIEVTPNMNFRKRRTALLQLKQLQAIRNLIEIEENQVYDQLEEYYITYEKDFMKDLLDDPDFKRYNHFTDEDFVNEDEFDEELYNQRFVNSEELYDPHFEELEGFHEEED